MKQREPDFTIYKPTDIWILGLLEDPPEGSKVHDMDVGVRIALRPHKEEVSYGTIPGIVQ